MNDIKAKVMPTDTVVVVNDSETASHIGEGELIVKISGEDSGLKYNIEIRGAEIQGVSEKQIGYAEDIRIRTAESAIKIVRGRCNTMECRLGKKYAETITFELAKHGMKSYAEFLAHAIASDRDRIGDLLTMSSAREIIDKYRM